MAECVFLVKVIRIECGSLSCPLQPRCSEKMNYIFHYLKLTLFKTNNRSQSQPIEGVENLLHDKKVWSGAQFLPIEFLEKFINKFIEKDLWHPRSSYLNPCDY